MNLPEMADLPKKIVRTGYSHIRIKSLSGYNSKDFMNKQYVAICEKVALTIEEAAEYSNIGQNRISSLLKEPRCPFVLYVGTKKLVKRKEFEKFISESVEI